MQMFSCGLFKQITTKSVLTTAEVFWLLALSKKLARAERTEGSVECSWLMDPFSVMLDYFSIKRAFLKVSVIPGNHFPMKMSEHRGGDKCCQCAEPLAEVRSRLYEGGGPTVCSYDTRVRSKEGPTGGSLLEMWHFHFQWTLQKSLWCDNKKKDMCALLMSDISLICGLWLCPCYVSCPTCTAVRY